MEPGDALHRLDGDRRPAGGYALRDRLPARSPPRERPRGAAPFARAPRASPGSPRAARRSRLDDPGVVLPRVRLGRRRRRPAGPGPGRTRASARLDRVGVRQGPGPLPDPRRRRFLDLRPRLAMQPVRDRAPRAPAEPLPIQPRPGRLPDLRGIRAGSPSSTWPGSCRTPRRRSGRARSRPGRPPPIGPILDELLADATTLGIPVDLPFAGWMPEQVRRVMRGRARAPGSRASRASSGRSSGRRTSCTSGSSSADGGDTRTCPACQGARLRPEALAVRIDGPQHRRGLGVVDPGVRAFLAGLASLRDHPVGGRLLGQVDGSAAIPRGDRPGLPDARPVGAEPLGRRAPAGRPDQGAGLGTGQHALRPRRALGRPASAGGRPPGRRSCIGSATAATRSSWSSTTPS